MDRRLLLLLAVACGLSSANLYYVQPLLDSIGTSLRISDPAAGLLVTATQVGYALGLAFLVPLGDIVRRRRLVVRLVLVVAGAQVAAALAPSFAVLAAAVVLVGVAAAVTQVLLPLASVLASDHERGRVVGTVMSGLLVGGLLARTVSGAVSDLGGWRSVFLVAAVLMAGLALLLARRLPEMPAQRHVPYPALLRSVLALVREEPVLRQRMWLGALGMASFSLLWTTIAFLLSRPPYGYSDTVIGLFGLAGLAGVLAAPVVGALADAGRGRLATSVALGVLLLGWVVLAAGERHPVVLVVGVVVLDFGVQGVQIGNQSAVFALRPDARSRIATAYMVAYFLGGMGGSVGGATAFAAGGWSATCALGVACAVVAIASWWRVSRERTTAVPRSA
jgi:predicted MFS family arabinose efflux permease